MFEYTKDCMVGVEQIDEEHQYLFSLMNQIMDAVHKGDFDERDELKHYVERLIEYGEVHFAHEEKYMEDTADIELTRQKLEHSMFLNKMRAIDMIELDDDEKRKILKDTLIYLTRWLYSHILSSDILIGRMTHIADKVMDEDEFFTFTEKYRTGIPEIDDEHRKLFDIIGRAYRLVENDASRDIYDDILGLLDELEEYTANHFTHEEEYMESIGYPGLEAQQRAHSIFLERLSERDLGEKIENQKEYLEDLLDFLFSWLGNHILRMDKPIGDFK